MKDKYKSLEDNSVPSFGVQTEEEASASFFPSKVKIGDPGYVKQQSIQMDKFISFGRFPDSDEIVILEDGTILIDIHGVLTEEESQKLGTIKADPAICG